MFNQASINTGTGTNVHATIASCPGALNRGNWIREMAGCVNNTISMEIVGS